MEEPIQFNTGGTYLVNKQSLVRKKDYFTARTGSGFDVYVGFNVTSIFDTSIPQASTVVVW